MHRHILNCTHDDVKIILSKQVPKYCTLAMGLNKDYTASCLKVYLFFI